MREVSGKTDILGIIGNPIEHTLSPLIHNTIAEIDGHDTVYIPFHIKNETLEVGVKGAHGLGVRGMNVTVPYKKEVMKVISDIDDMAKAIGAVNTLVYEENGFKGYNTDAYGFSRELKENGIDVDSKDVIIVGAGGATNAVVNALLSMGAAKIYMLNRSTEKAKAAFGSIPEVEVYALSEWDKIAAGKYFCAQCTSVGLAPNDDESPIMDEGFFDLVDSVVDIIYRPAETKFMKLAKEHGARVFNGLDMLLYQAIESYRLFTGHEVSEKAIDEARRRLLKALN